MAAWIWFGLFGALTNLAAIVLLLAALGPRVPARLKLLQRRAVACALIGTCGSVFAVLLGFVAAFGALGGESVDPSQKARIVAEGIGEAMNSAAVGLLTAPLPIAAWVRIAILARRAVAPKGPRMVKSVDDCA